jgi:cell division protein FtsA
MDEVIVGLDIGTTKTCAVVGFLSENGQMEIAGVGVAPSKGMKTGVIINIDNTIASIAKAMEDAELMAGAEVSTAIVGLSGQQMQGENSRGVVAVANRNRTITHSEIKRVIEAAQAIVIPADREIVHVLSREFSVDSQTGIKDPVGMSGVRLEAEVHIITGASPSIMNLAKAVAGAGLECRDIVFSPLASAEAVLSRDEKELGVAIVDIGGGTTDILVYIDGGPSYSSVLPLGGSHVTSDISIGLRTPIDSAEVIKKKYGCSLAELVDPTETVEVPSVGGRAPRRIFRQELAGIIEPRMMEIMEMVDKELIKCGKKSLIAAGVVITGGGSMIDGAVDLAEKVFNLPVRVGAARDLSGLKDKVASPVYANAVGLLKYGIRTGQYRTGKPARKKGKSMGLGSAIKKFMEDYF